MNEVRIVHKLAIHGMGKAPLAARDGLPRAFGGVANRKSVFRAARIVDRITFSSAGSKHDMSQRHVISFFGRREIGTRQPANLFSSRNMSNRGGETEFLSIFRDVKLPAQPRNRVPFAQQKSVSEFAVCIRRISAVHQPQDSSSPAI